MSDAYPVLQGGLLHAPLFIFVRTTAPTSVVLSGLGLSAAPVKGSRDKDRNRLYLIRGQHWVHVCDSCGYDLWHRPGRREMLATAGRRWEVFSYWVGDVDESYELLYFHDGRLSRHRAVASPGYSDRIVQTDLGAPMPGETAAVLRSDASVIGRTLAAALGIDVCYTPDRVEHYRWSSSDLGSPFSEQGSVLIPGGPPHR